MITQDQLLQLMFEMVMQANCSFDRVYKWAQKYEDADVECELDDLSKYLQLLESLVGQMETLNRK